jgi:glycosyltransferase involved in cell wall biosynthesis
MLRNRLYYRLKPFIPQSLRAAVRRRLAARLRDRVGDIWPIMPGSERPPDGWPGWPDGRKFALILTHDVEGREGLKNCRALMRLELELGFRSSFNFVPEGDYKVPTDLREELVRNGFEVGIHDLRHDGRLFASRRAFKKRAAKINQYIQKWGAVGFRSGFMLHNLEWFHDLDIQYDASTFDTDPFEPQPEGRHTIFPFWVPRPTSLNDSLGGYVELPYTLPQDSTLFLLLAERSPAIWLRKLDWIADHGGMALLDTHPDYMSSNGSTRRTREYPIELYKELLDYVRSKHSGMYWNALPGQVAAYVRERTVSPHEQVGPSTRKFDFPGQEVARDLGNAPFTTRLLPIPAEETSTANSYATAPPHYGFNNRCRLHGKRAAVLLFSYYPADPRPRRAAEALAKEGVSVDLICLRASEKEPAHETINGVSIFRVQQKRYRGDKKKYIYQYAAFILTSFTHLTLRSLIRRYDFVHVHNMPDALVFSALVPKVLGARIILDLHDPMPELMQTIFNLPEKSRSVRLLKQLEKWSIRFADIVLTVNLACKEIYSSRSCAPEKINVVLNSPDDDIFRFQPSKLGSSNGRDPAKPFVILYHGSLVRRNGFDLAVDALEMVRKRIPTARLMVCGERTSFFDEVMESAQKRGLLEAVQYVGARNLHQIVEAIESCDLGIIPNHRNIFTEINTPTRIFEYLALGKPVIAPQAKGIQDYFGKEDLLFFNLGDAGDLAQKIEFAFFHPHDLEQIVKRGQEIYLAHTWSRERLNLLNPISELI